MIDIIIYDVVEGKRTMTILSEEDKVYEDIKIDKKATLESLRELFAKAKGFALAIGYITKETLNLLIRKAASEEKIIAGLIKENNQNKQEEK